MQLGRENVAFYIDKDRSKKSKFGKKVVHPDDISDWHGLHVYVPYNYYDEISRFLMGKGLKEGIDFCKFENKVFISPETAAREYDRAMKEAKAIDAVDCGKIFAVYNRFWGKFNSGILRYLIHKPDAVLVSKAVWYSAEETRELSGAAVAMVLPAYFDPCVFISGGEQKSSIDDIESADEDVVRLADSIHLYHDDLPYRLCMLKAIYIQRFADAFFSCHRFKAIVADGSDTPEDMLVSNVWRKYGLPFLYSHAGVIPGTYYISQGGDLGSSLPSVYHEQFRKLPVTKTQCDHVQRVLQFLFNERMNRKVQPKTNWRKELEGHVVEGRPVIFCVGQNDRDCAMVPYTEESRQYHSPIYQSSYEMGAAIAKIAEAHGWNVIFKPHPMYVRENEIEKLPPSVCYIEQADINDLIDYSDVVVTAGSSTSYIAQIRHKPVLMVGYNQTHGQGCTYEAYRAEDVEPQLCAAVEHGYTSAQQEAFVEHVARLLAYNLYDDMTDRPIRYGMLWPERVEEFFTLGERLIAMKRKDNEKDARLNMTYSDYVQSVAGGLQVAVATRASGEVISIDDAFEIWVERAKRVRDELHGLTFFCGNGASATMAEHMSHDWFQNAAMNTQTCSETAHLTAISNDLSYEDVFAFRIGRILSERDILVTISSSGNSPNIVKALETARKNGVYCITLSGMKEDNRSRSLGDLNFYVKLPTYGLVESAHAVLLHAALDHFLETYMGGMH